MPFLRTTFAAATVIALTAAASAKPVTLAVETNLRAAPGTKSEVVTLIPKGSEIDVGECDAGWCKVKFGDREGFAIARNLGEASPVTTGSTASNSSNARTQNPVDLQKLRRGYEDYFDGDGRNDQAADLPTQRRTAQSRTRQQTQDDYYDDDDDGPVVAYGRPAYVPGPPVYYSYYYPFPRPYYYAPRYYYRRW
jgi:uncharacterized protein YraI